MNERLRSLAVDTYGASFRDKESSLLMGIFGLLLRIVTLGKVTKAQWARATTTVGTRIYYPGLELSDATLAHEITHLSQQEKLGRLRFMLKYATRKGRCDLEQDAYITTNMVRAIHKQPTYIPKQVENMSGPLYMWACRDPHKVEVRLVSKLRRAKQGLQCMEDAQLENDIREAVEIP